MPKRKRILLWVTTVFQKQHWIDRLHNLARWLYRPAHEFPQLLATKNIFTRMAVLVLLWSCGIGAFFYIGSSETKLWLQGRPTIKFPMSEMKIIYDLAMVPKGKICSNQHEFDHQCLSTISFPEAMSMATSRQDDRHAEKRNNAVGKIIWFGLEIPVSQLKEALNRKANFLGLGWLRGDFELWMDGQFQLSGKRGDVSPVVLPVPNERLAQEKPIQLFWVMKQSHKNFRTDYFNGSLGLGMFDNTAIEGYRGYANFWSVTKPMTLLMLNIMASFLFAGVWFMMTRKQEYFWISMMTFLGAAIQLRYLAWTFLRLPYEILLPIGLSLIFYEGASVMYLGMAIARFRSAIFKFTIPVIMIIPPLIFSIVTDSQQRYTIEDYMAELITPGFFLLGTLACLMQAFYLNNQRQSNIVIPARVQQLLLSGLALAVTGAMFWWESYEAGNAGTDYQLDLFPCRLAFLVVSFYLGAVLFKEFREQDRLLRNTPVSDYHKQTPLVDSIHGIMMIADLKDSEWLYRARANAQDGLDENLVTIWRSQIYVVVAKYNGVFLSSKGDEVSFFFDQSKKPDVLLSSMQAFIEMQQVSSLLAKQFSTQYLNVFEDGKELALNFRCTLVEGTIRPIWEELVGSRQASWEEANDSTPFVDAARMLEMEKKIMKEVSNPRSKTTLIMKDSLEQKINESNLLHLHGLNISVEHSSVMVKAKHDVQYVVSIFMPGKRLTLVKSSESVDMVTHVKKAA